MEFDSDELAYQFYNEYGRHAGFSIRKHYRTQSRKDGIVNNRRFVCSKEGERAKLRYGQAVISRVKLTRTKCRACLGVRLSRETNKWFVTAFSEVHNHELHKPEVTHMMLSQRRLTQVQKINASIAADSGLSLKASLDLMSAQVGGKENLGFSNEDLKWYLRTRRQRDMEYGGLGGLMKYLQDKTGEDPTFYYAVQMDCSEYITNIFWADGRMINDYADFGDVVSFDTTFRTNKESRPFGCFVGFNHFRQTVIFGAALMYDETIPSFEWVFQTFVHAMSGKKPLTIFTDQDQAMTSALKNILPDTFHGLCTWHLSQNALNHLGYLCKQGSSFLRDLSACFYSYETVEELDEAWCKILIQYELEANTWMQKTWNLREKWAHVYMKWHFSGGMRSTQLSESFNAMIRRYLNKDHNLSEFFTHFDRVLENVRYNELKSLFILSDKIPSLMIPGCDMLLTASRHYTYSVFEIFQQELLASITCKVKQCENVDVGVRFDVTEKTKIYHVIGNREAQTVCCNCKKFESFGILCRHALKALDRMDIADLPRRYILGRWSKNAKACSSYYINTNTYEEDPKLLVATRYRTWCHAAVKMVAMAVEHENAFKHLSHCLPQLCQEIEKIVSMNSFNEDGVMKNDGYDEIESNFTCAKGFKKKEVKVRNTKRMKSWQEKLTQKKQKTASKGRHDGGVLQLFQ
ncbi:Protein FAR1-RELATED SEQUENCE 5 [Platanthera zijinensis]|uniref:Protein FAR1-RELATED SEQUENCE 5 n=1 Tax=Platanthera zijinensis TaxID=2320716 RepID=A0AAP0AWR9_9ASPA